MSGDYTRFTFNPAKDYSGVLKQQGRVDLDADWNELIEILDRRWRAETIDIIGHCVVPRETPDGFRIQVSGGTLTIGPGRIYVDGILAENHGEEPLEEMDNVLGEVRSSQPIPYDDQPYYPSPLPPLLSGAAGTTDLVYLDVWQREVTAIEDPGIQEIALGDPDTTTRIQTVWQVKALEGVGGKSCTDTIKKWDDLVMPSSGRLTTSTIAPPTSADPCIISPAGGYRGLENRLYRVEIHTPGPLGTAKFKWSRDNGSVVSTVEAIPAGRDQLTVRRLGRDQVLRFHVGDWIEVLDDHTEFKDEAGHMAKVTNIDEANRILTIAPAIKTSFNFDATDPDRHTRVRRWDQKKNVDANGLLDVTAGPIDIEDGIQVSFSEDPVGGSFKVGDYWVFAARTADGSVEVLKNTPPRGILHHYCRLALVTWERREARRLVSFIDGEVVPDPAESWEVSEDGRIWTLKLVQGVTMPDGTPFTSKVVARILDKYLGALPEIIDDYTIRIVGLEDEFLKQLSEIPIIDAGLWGWVQDCRRFWPPARRQNCCTVTVGDGVTSVGDFNDIQEAIDSLPTEEVYRVCILPGAYRLREAVKIQRDDVIISGCGGQTNILGPAKGPAFRVEDSWRVGLESLSVRALSPSGAILMKDCRRVYVTECRVINGRGLPSVSVQAEHVQITRNRCHGGGIWIWDGSSKIRIQDNEITEIKGGPGIVLGGLPESESPSDRAAGVQTVEILGNDIWAVANSGISTVTAIDKDPNLGELQDVTIAHNRITECALGGPDPAYDDFAVGGIVLRNVSGLRIHDNHIANNGDEEMPACGILVHLCQDLEVTDNRIVDNGSSRADLLRCVDFRTVDPGSNPLDIQNVTFTVYDPSGKVAKATEIVEFKGFKGLHCGSRTEIQLPFPVPKVWLLTAAFVSEPGRIEAFNEDDSSASTVEMTHGLVPVELTGTALKRIVIDAPEGQVLLLQFCFGQPGYQAGIAAFFVLGGSDQASGGRLAAAPQAALIHDNVVVCPRGQALVALGMGPMSITENTLTSQGERKQPPAVGGPTDYLVSRIAQLGRCVFIFNLGINPGFADAIAGFGSIATTHFTHRTTAGPAIAVGAVTSLLTVTDGRILFHGNQVTLKAMNQAAQVLPASVVLASLDDVSQQDNQIVSRTIEGSLLANVITMAPTVRASNNRFTELPRRASLSCFSWGMMNTTTDNQGTHSICAFGTNVVDRDNQVIFVTFPCKNLAAAVGLTAAASAPA